MLREKELILLENLKKENARKTEEIQQLRNNQLIGQASGEESITITDGALAFANILEETEIEVEGEKKKAYLVGLPQGLSRQEQREGYNILPNLTNLENTNINGINCSIINNEINANGTATAGINKKIATTHINLKANTDYTFVLFTKGIAAAPLGSQALLFGTDSITNKISVPFTSNSNTLKNFTPTEDYTFDRISLYVGGSSTSSGINFNVKIKIMILEGTYTEETLPAYEQYGATPSIEYPSEIENLKVYNLFDKSTVINNKYIDATGNENVNNQWVITDYMEVDSNSNYTYFGLTSVGSAPYSAFYDSNKTFISSFKQAVNKNTIKTPVNAKYVRFSIIINDLNTFIFYKGTENNLYAPYGAISIGLGNKNILPIIYTKGQHINSATGIDIDFIEKNRIKLNGTATSNLNLNIINGNVFKWKKGKTYCLQLKIIEGSYSGQPLYLHTEFKNDYRDVYNNLQADISNNFKNTINIDEDGYSNKCLVYAKAGIVFNNLVIEVQLEENTIATDIVIPESEEHSLRIGNLELNGIGAIRDSLVIELADENISDKKIKKIYLNKKNYKYVFTGTENIIIPATPVSEGVKCYKIVLPKVFSNNYVKADCNRCSFLTDSGEWLNASDKTDIAVLSVAAEGPSMYWRVPEGEIPDVTSMSNYLKNNETYITYPLKNPELIDITDDNIELVKDVEYLINNFKTFKEVTHVEVENGYIDLEYVKSTELAFKNMQQQIDNIQAVMLEGGTNNA